MHSRGFLVRIFTSVIRVRSSPSVKDQTSWQFMQIAKKAYRGEVCAHSAAKARRTGWKKAEVQGVLGKVTDSHRLALAVRL